MTIKSLTGPARPGVSLDDGSTEKFKVFCRPPQTRNNNNNTSLHLTTATSDHLRLRRSFDGYWHRVGIGMLTTGDTFMRPGWAAESCRSVARADPPHQWRAPEPLPAACAPASAPVSLPC